MKKYLFVSLVIFAVFSSCTSLVQTAYTDDLYYVPNSVAVSNNNAADSINVVDNRNGLTYTKAESYDGFADARDDNYISDNNDNFSNNFESDDYCSRLRFFHNSYFYNPYYFNPLDVDPWFFTYNSYRPHFGFGFNSGGWDMYWGMSSYYSYYPGMNSYWANPYWMGFYDGYYYGGGGYYNSNNYTSVLSHRRGINHYSGNRTANNELVLRNKQRIGSEVNSSASTSIKTTSSSNVRFTSPGLAKVKGVEKRTNGGSTSIKSNSNTRFTSADLAKVQFKNNTTSKNITSKSRLTVRELARPVMNSHSSNQTHLYTAKTRNSLNKIILNNRSIGNVRVNHNNTYYSNNGFVKSNKAYRNANSGFSNKSIRTNNVNTYNNRTTSSKGNRVIRANSNSNIRHNVSNSSRSSNNTIRSSSSKSSSSKSSSSSSSGRRRR